ncbi:MAG: hypothetical protein OEL87_03250 [Nanoarchaeota archaeon]|nr:hypothetical protein [Nanoarchaeota archaeon]
MVEMKIFGLFDASEVRVEDPGMKKVINLNSKLMLKSHGRIKWDPTRSKVNVVERLVNLLQVPGSRGKKHRIIQVGLRGNILDVQILLLMHLKLLKRKLERIH